MTGLSRALVPMWIRRRIRSAIGRAEAVVHEARRRRLVAGLGDLRSPERVGAAYAADSDMWQAETLMLYALARALRPQRVLEIGAFRGGSGLVLANALEDVGSGRIVGIDPERRFEPDTRYHGRYTLLRGLSPGCLEAAVRILGGSVDLVLIDGLHTYSGVRADLEGVLPYLAKDSYVIHHDAYHCGINRAVEEFCTTHAGIVSDCGFIARTAALDEDPWVAYCGLRLLRVNARPGIEHIHIAYQTAGLPLPELHEGLSDHDHWACAHLSPCAHCAGSRADPNIDRIS